MSHVANCRAFDQYAAFCGIEAKLVNNFKLTTTDMAMQDSVCVHADTPTFEVQGLLIVHVFVSVLRPSLHDRDSQAELAVEQHREGVQVRLHARSHHSRVGVHEVYVRVRVDHQVRAVPARVALDAESNRPAFLDLASVRIALVQLEDVRNGPVSVLKEIVVFIVVCASHCTQAEEESENTDGFQLQFHSA